jgi:hypothetical protein
MKKGHVENRGDHEDRQMPLGQLDKLELKSRVSKLRRPERT